MKYSTLHKVMLTTMAMVASLALNAQAGQPANSSAQQDKDSAASASRNTNQIVLAPSASESKIARITADPALWYNGDFDDVNGLANERDTSLGAGQYASVYDDFNVTDSNGWDVTSVFSDNLSSTNVTGATWEIRQGVSEGNGGTLVASGMTVTPTVTPTGRSGFGFIEYMVEIEGLSVHLNPGTYFLNVTPTGDLTGRSFDSTTVGANCVGTPCGNNQNAFFDSNFFGAVFTSTANESQPYDFSMGVNGTVSGEGEIVLTAKLRRQTGDILVALNYTGTDHSGTVDILRDGVVVHTANDTGRAQDRPGAVSHVEYTYQVCETGTSTCSNTVTVRVP